MKLVIVILCLLMFGCASPTYYQVRGNGRVYYTRSDLVQKRLFNNMFITHHPYSSVINFRTLDGKGVQLQEYEIETISPEVGKSLEPYRR